MDWRALHRLIERPDINDNNQFVLQTETSYPHTSSREFKPLKKEDEEIEAGNEEKRLELAFGLLTDRIAESVEAVRVDPALSDEKKAPR